MPARTMFKLTDQEVAQALVNYVESQGETVPKGNWHVWTRDIHDDIETLTILVVDHSI